MGEVKNGEEFERILDSFSEEIGQDERVLANKIGAEAFKTIMQPQ